MIYVEAIFLRPMFAIKLFLVNTGSIYKIKSFLKISKIAIVVLKVAFKNYIYSSNLDIVSKTTCSHF